ncbi:MAG: hypothetical protein C1943_06900 [Halochromatium sp.]|nr:hypothetical protein [Halochromatium sp.]
MLADHGLAQSLQYDRHYEDPLQDHDGLSDRCDVVTQSLLDLGRHDPARIDPAAQRFDLGPGTADSRLGAAMDAYQLDLALSAGRHAVERAKLEGIRLIQAQGAGVGAGITNQLWWLLFGRWPVSSMATDAGLRLACRHRRTERDPLALDARVRASGVGGVRSLVTGVDLGPILQRHAMALSNPYLALRHLGGFEHAALVGSALAAAQLGLRWQGLGESAAIARLLALCLNPSVAPWLGMQSHVCAGCQILEPAKQDDAEAVCLRQEDGSGAGGEAQLDTIPALIGLMEK